MGIARKHKGNALEAGIEHKKPAVEHILKTALRCLSQRDCETLSMREIAAEAKVSKSLLHYHFKSKDHLVLMLIEKFFDSMTRRIGSATDRLTRETGSNAEAFGGSLDAIWGELRRAGDMQAIVFRLAAQGTLDPAVRKKLVRFREHVLALTVTGVRRSLGERANLLPVDAIAEVMLSCLTGFEVSRFFVGKPKTVDEAFQVWRAGLVAMANLFAPMGVK